MKLNTILKLNTALVFSMCGIFGSGASNVDRSEKSSFSSSSSSSSSSLETSATSESTIEGKPLTVHTVSIKNTPIVEYYMLDRDKEYPGIELVSVTADGCSYEYRKFPEGTERVLSVEDSNIFEVFAEPPLPSGDEPFETKAQIEENDPIKCLQYGKKLLPSLQMGKDKKRIKVISTAAIECFRKALNLNGDEEAPALPEHLIMSAWKGLGDVYNKIKRYDDAIEAFTKALENESGDKNTIGQVYNALGMAYYHKKQYKESLVEFEKATKVDGYHDNDKALSHYSAGIIAEMLKEHSVMVYHFSNALAFKKNEFSGLYGDRRIAALKKLPEELRTSDWGEDLGHTYLQLKKNDEAIQAFKDALDKDEWKKANMKECALISLGTTYVYKGDEDSLHEAINSYLKSLQIPGITRENEKKAYFSIAHTYKALHRMSRDLDTRNYNELAAEYYEKSLEEVDGKCLLSNDLKTRSLRTLALSYSELNQYEKAANTYNRFIHDWFSIEEYNKELIASGRHPEEPTQQEKEGLDLIELGKNCFVNGAFQKAAEYYEAALKKTKTLRFFTS